MSQHSLKDNVALLVHLAPHDGAGSQAAGPEGRPEAAAGRKACCEVCAHGMHAAAGGKVPVGALEAAQLCYLLLCCLGWFSRKVCNKLRLHVSMS